MIVVTDDMDEGLLRKMPLVQRRVACSPLNRVGSCMGVPRSGRLELDRLIIGCSFW